MNTMDVLIKLDWLKKKGKTNKPVADKINNKTTNEGEATQKIEEAWELELCWLWKGVENLR